MRNQVQIRSAKSPVLATELKLAGSNELAIGQYAGSGRGELNASSKKDLLVQQQKFLAAASQGKMLQIDSATDRELVAAAFNDKESHRLLAEKISDALYVTANRQGFMRKYLSRIDAPQGSIVRFPMRMKNVTAVVSTSPTKIQSQTTRDNWYTPPEVQIVARPFIPENELNQSSGDVLQEKYIEGVEATMVTEDRMWYNQVNSLVGVDNNLTLVAGQLTPYTLMTVVSNVTRWGLKGAHLLMASDLWQDVVGNTDFYSAIDPVARHELLLTGELGTIYGMTVTSDAYRHAEHKVLNAGEFFVISDALHHGAYSDRGGLKSQPIDSTVEHAIGRGFLIYESLAVSVSNSRSVAKGIRL